MAEVVQVGEGRLREVVAVHCDAFAQYPTMQYVLGTARPDDRRLTALIDYFIATTHLKGGVILAIEADGRLVAAADTVFSAASEPPEPPEPPELIERRAATWRLLGREAQERYEAYSEMTRPFSPEEPHFYLSMLGVRQDHSGQGLARPLLEAVQALSRDNPLSTGVALETEVADNVPFYEYFGYRVVGHQVAIDGVESWGFFRPDSA